MRTRRYFVVTVLTLACFAGAAAGAAPAAADSVVAASCAGVVTGVAGQDIVLDPRSVADPIAKALGPLDPLGVLAGPFRAAWNNMPPIPLGTLPAGQTVISGTQIADAVVQRLRETPAVAPVLEPLIPSVYSALATACGILARGSQPAAPGAGTPTSPSQPGGQGDAPTSPSPDNSNMLVSAQDSAASGSVTSFGIPISGLLPDGPALSFGVPVGTLAGGTGATGAKNQNDAASVNSQRSVGTAKAMPLKEERLPLSMLLAVLMLTLVSAQLVRTWVLRAQR